MTMGHMTLTTPLLRVFCHPQMGLYIAYPCTKFDDSNINRSGDMDGVHQTIYGSRDLTTSLSGMVGRPRAGTFYDQPAYQI